MAKHWHLIALAVVGGVTIDSAIKLGLWLWDRRKQNKQVAPQPATPAAQQQSDFFYENIFFPESTAPCRFHYRNADCHRRDCPYTHEAALLDKLLNSFTCTTKTLDICVYQITCTELQNAIIKVHHRGVRVRIITDGSAVDDTAAKVERFRSSGIGVRTNSAGFLMHHKFVIVDGKVLINGSFNWTWGAITGNHENLFITNDTKLVAPYIHEFKKLWQLYDPESILLQSADNGPEALPIT